MTAVSLRKLRKTYGAEVAVEGIDLDIARGELIVLLGPSGCGKSTTLRMVAGLEAISSGELYIDGQNVTALEPKDRDIAMVFQNYALYPHKTIQANLSFGLKMRGIPTRDIQTRVAAAAEMLDITHLLDRKPAQLSGGQMQRVALGRALVRDPAVFLLDEPLSNLDAKLRARMREEIAHLQRRIGKAMIYVTHDQTEAMTLADRIVIMRDGQVQQIGSPLAVYDQPANAFVAGFIGSPEMNLIEAVLDEGRLLFGENVAIEAPTGLTGEIQKLTVGIRPEAVVPATDGLPFTVRSVEQLGSQTLFVGELAGQRLRVMTPRRDGVAPGSQMNIALPTDALHFFNRDSGARLIIDSQSSKP